MRSGYGVPQVAGIVMVRQSDGSLGPPVSGAQVWFRALDGAGAPVAVATNAAGRYVVELPVGDWAAGVLDPDDGTTGTWRRLRVQAGRDHTSNHFLDAPLRRLHTLVGAFPGEIGIFATRFDTGAQVALNADAPRYLASVAKVAIAVGIVDQLRGPDELGDAVELSLYDHRDERKEIAYEDLGTRWTVGMLLRTMISDSDTTATDVLVARYDVDEVNRRFHRLVDGFSRFSSMIELDRRRYWMAQPEFARWPRFAFGLYRRHRATTWLDQLGLEVPGSQDWPSWDEYRTDGREQASPRALGALLSALAGGTLFAEAWKHDVMLDTVLAAGSVGEFRRVDTDTRYVVNGKGGTHDEVVNEAGVVRSGSGGTPIAALVVCTERHDSAMDRGDINAIVDMAGELAFRALGFDLSVPAPNAGSSSPLVWLAPVPGEAFEHGDRPLIRWDSAGMQDPLTLVLEDRGGAQRAISTTASDDGEWHSFRFPDDLESDDEYRFLLSGTDTNGTAQQASSPRFAVGGSIHVTRPVAGEAWAPGSTPPIRWWGNGVSGDLTVRLKRHGTVVDTFSTRARDDGAWNSWTIPADLPRGRGYKVEVISNSDPDINDRSPAFVVGGRIEVQAPADGSVLDVGSEPTIRWTTHDVVGPLRIELLGPDGRTVDTIATRARNDGAWHSWTVPQVEEGDHFRIRVSERDNREIEGHSAIFQIGTRYEWDVPSIDGAARGNSTLQSRPHFVAFGESPTFRWRRIGAEKGRLVIELLRAGTFIERFTDNAVDDGEWHSWTAPADLTPSSRYSLRLWARDTPSASGRSVHFAVGARIAVSVGRKRIVTGNTVTVNWQTEGLRNSAMQLDVVANDDSRIVSIGRPRSRTSMVWNVQTTATPDRNMARVRATSIFEPQVVGYSEWFELNP